MNPQKEKAHTSKSGFLGKLPIWLSILAGIAILATVIVFIIDVLVSISGKGASLGVFGDFFGGVLNPIVSIIGFMAVLYTLNKQHLDAEEQKQTTALTNKTQIKQQFEGTFFRLLEMLYYSLKNSKKQNDYTNGIKNIYQVYEANICFDIYKSSDYNYIVTYYDPPFRLLKAILELVDSFYYEDRQPISLIKDKNLYIRLVLDLINKDLILIFVMQFIEDEEALRYDKDKLKIKKLLDNLGVLRDLDYSPFNKKLCALQLVYSDLPLTKTLARIFNEQAFKPIEVPPVNL
ncbi:MAG: hypothetical protein E6Q83_15955 [Thiothrix sp.]|nr:MAG: hypothetical protein E6Q83_15955 [Thiothrix sp.]